jgi:hypothetical protein
LLSLCKRPLRRCKSVFKEEEEWEEEEWEEDEEWEEEEW